MRYRVHLERPLRLRDPALKRTLVPMLSFPASGAALVALLLGVLALPAAAQRDKPTIVPEKPPTPQRPSDRKVALVDSPLHLSEFSSGRDGMEPSPALAAQLTHITGFIQRSPVDGKVPANATEVWVGRTHSAIYFVFVCHDSRPESIRSHLARRENIFKDDHVSVLLDTFQDHRLGTLFTVNPAGVQGDAAYSEATGSDYRGSLHQTSKIVR